MLNNVVLDVVIGLLFLFLIYSLLATIIVELFTTLIGLRARNLKEAINRMLTDEQPVNRYKGLKQADLVIDRFLRRLGDSLLLMKNPSNAVIDRFYDNPEIKYLGSSGVFRNPSSFKAVSFSKTMIYMLNGAGPIEKNRIEAELRNAGAGLLGKETSAYVLSLWQDSHGDITRFKVHLEAWFDRTMEQATEWYKRKTQVILLLLGMVFATFFNVDAFVVAKHLSTDKDAREQIVNLATAYAERDGAASQQGLPKDTLLAIKKRLEADIAQANSILGLGGWLPDTLEVIRDISGALRYSSPVDEEALRRWNGGNPIAFRSHKFRFWEKMDYLRHLLAIHFWGFFVMALAISLGAPFWFDLLNKVVQLRTSTKQPIASPHTSRGDAISPSNREG